MATTHHVHLHLVHHTFMIARHWLSRRHRSTRLLSWHPCEQSKSFGTASSRKSTAQCSATSDSLMPAASINRMSAYRGFGKAGTRPLISGWFGTFMCHLGVHQCVCSTFGSFSPLLPFGKFLCKHMMGLLSCTNCLLPYQLQYCLHILSMV